ncbi:MAG: RNA polymerase sigma-70 factor, ECF subfamily [Candidatus Magnetoglobus multicellularis str. Araruama]|uniref:RNA polymerase sigma-70 factor, ECF subfamily n=1 Tax=Candidatus Magnetoglobus multicellularis str. Araruama TaxID=890399 RepID=A0A1V1P8H8_9BACT|nr:MAG: RNA polymerase sigma-70 factor, ECF subfamily [Candidatus Magnetoglobus multicellularis str. Araruama]
MTDKNASHDESVVMQLEKEDMMLLLKDCLDHNQCHDLFYYFRKMIRRVIKLTLHEKKVTYQKEDIKEIYNEVCLHFLENDKKKFRQYDPDKSSLSTWIWLLSMRKVVDLLRGKKVIMDVSPASLENLIKDETEGADENLITDEKKQILANALKELPHNQRLVIKLKYFHDYSTKEIAKTLDLRENTIDQIALRARKN